MKNQSGIRRAAMGALVAAALIAGAGVAGAGPYQFPDDASWPSKMPGTRVRIAGDGSGGLIGRVRMVLAAAYRFPVEEGGGVRIRRFPASRQPRLW